MNYRLEIENKFFEDRITLKLKIFWFWVTIKKIEFKGLDYIGRKKDLRKTISYLVIKYSIPGNQIIVNGN